LKKNLTRIEKMDIKEATEAEKQDFFEKADEFFKDIRNTLNILEKDIKNEDLIKQAVAVWVTGNFEFGYRNFMAQVGNVHLQKDEIQKQIKSIAEEEKLDD